MAHCEDQAGAAWPDPRRERQPVGEDPALIRAQLARMSEPQLQRLLLWLDQRGAAAGKTFAVHQVDPRDPASRDLIELQVRGPDGTRSRRRLRVPALARRLDQPGAGARP